MRRPSSPRLVQRARDVDLVHDVVEPVLAEDQRARLRYGTQGLGGEHGSDGGAGRAACSVFPAPRARQACNCALSR